MIIIIMIVRNMRRDKSEWSNSPGYKFGVLSNSNFISRQVLPFNWGCCGKFHFALIKRDTRAGRGDFSLYPNPAHITVSS